MAVDLYTTCSVLTVGCPVFTDTGRTTPASNGVYYDGVTCWTVSGGIITGTGACTTTSTTTTTTTVFSCAQCKTWQYSSIPSGGDIVYYYSCINGTLQSIGLSDTDPNGTFCNCNSVGNPFTSVSPGGTTLTELGTCDPFATTTTTTTTTSTTTTTTTEAPPAYNYYTFTPCTGGTGVDYRSIQSLALGDIYTFLPYPPDRGCYEITSITATPNSNDLPTIYGPLSGCNDDNCQQL